MDYKWIVIPIIVFLTFGIANTTSEYNNFVYPENSGVYNSNIYDTKDRIYIKGVNLNVEFVRGDNIYISHVKNVDIKDDSMDIETPSFPFRSEVNVEIGRDHNYEEINISGVRINLLGEVNTNELNIDGTGIDINSNINSKDIDISGTGIGIKGLINTENMHISGTDIDLRFKTSFLEKLVINSTGLSGEIIFLEKWNDDTEITISSLGGDIEFEIPSGSRNYLDVNTSVNVRTNTKYY